MYVGGRGRAHLQMETLMSEMSPCLIFRSSLLPQNDTGVGAVWWVFQVY